MTLRLLTSRTFSNEVPYSLMKVVEVEPASDGFTEATYATVGKIMVRVQDIVHHRIWQDQHFIIFKQDVSSFGFSAVR